MRKIPWYQPGYIKEEDDLPIKGAWARIVGPNYVYAWEIHADRIVQEATSDGRTSGRNVCLRRKG